MASEPPTSPPPFQFTGETPPPVARAIEELARHQAAVARFEAAVRTFEVRQARLLAEQEQRRIAAAERQRDTLARQEAAEAREEARRERQAAGAAQGVLREAVQYYVRQLRADGVPPQHMLITLKTIVRRAVRSPEPPPEPDVLTSDMVEWGIAEYYAA
jgi:hypothetical protein